jgi:hypothetical protein
MELHEKILNDIVSTIEKEIERFDGKIPSTEKKIFDKVLELTKDLEVKNGRITNSIKNINSIGKLLKEVESIIVNKEYVKDVDSMLKVFDEIEGLQKNYFSSLAVDVGRNKLLGAIKNDAINYTVDQLTEAGIRAEFGEGLKNILQTNIRSGGSYADLTDQLREYVKGGKDADGKPIPGKLQRYTRGAVTDALNQYSASYNETVASGLNWKWRMYTGSLIETSRPWCVHMIGKKYVHESELSTVITDNINGVKICSAEIPCNKKTGLPSGMMKGTNAENISQRRGGWGCGHQFGIVPDSVVPKAIRDKIAA